MVKEEEIMAEAAGGGGRSGYLDMLGLGEEAAMADYFLCLSPSSCSAAVSTTASATPAAAAAFSPTCASYLHAPPPYHHHVLSFGGQQAEEQYRGGDSFGFQWYGGGGGGGDRAIPAQAVPQRSSPTTECSSSISSISTSSPTAISSSKPQQAAVKKKGSRGADQRKTASAAAPNKRPRVRRERLGERIVALQQLVSPFGKTDTASVLHEALGYIRFLHDQVQVLSSPYMERLPPSARVVAPVVAVEQQQPRRASDLRSRGLCLVPISCTDHVAGGDGADDVWSTVTAGLSASAAASAATEDRGAAAMVRGGRPGQLA